MKLFICIFVVLILSATAVNSNADSVATANNASNSVANGVSQPAVASASNEVKDYLKNALENPDTLNKVLQTYLVKDSGWHFLKDVDFKFKAFQTTGTNPKTSLGFSYDYAKTISNFGLTPSCDGDCVYGFNASISTTGNVAFDQSLNPDDFLNTKLRFSFFNSLGGAKKFSSEDQNKYNQLAKDLAAITSQDALNKKYEQMIKLTSTHLTNQFYYDLSGNISVESNQSFSKTQFVYSASSGLDFKGWEKSNAISWADSSALSQLNIIDYPFALVRMLTGYSSNFVPRGLSLPTLILEIGLVTPVDGDPRKAVGDGSNYPRFNTEVSFKTPLAKYSDNVVSLSANYRFYQEIGASQVVKDAGLDQYSYFSSSIGCATGPFISYTNGKLPLEAKSSQIYSLGFQTHF